MSTLENVLDRTAADINAAMSRVYGYMGLAVLVSMFVSYQVGSNHDLMQFFFTGAIKWVVLFAPLVYIFFVPILLNAGIGAVGAGLVLSSFAALMGLSLSAIFVVYSMGSIVTAFMGAAVLFGTLSFYGYFTKRDLTSLGEFMFIGLIAIVIASIINIFLASSVFQTVISALAIIIFLGLTAYDTQTIREQIMEESTPAVEVMGAMSLYLNFINIFIHLLQLFGVMPGNDD